MIKLAGLWESKTKNGEWMLKGKLSYGANLFILANGFKQGENDPDYNVYIVEAKPKSGSAAAGKEQARPSGPPARPAAPQAVAPRPRGQIVVQQGPMDFDDDPTL